MVNGHTIKRLDEQLRSIEQRLSPKDEYAVRLVFPDESGNFPPAPANVIRIGLDDNG